MNIYESIRDLQRQIAEMQAQQNTASASAAMGADTGDGSTDDNGADQADEADNFDGTDAPDGTDDQGGGLLFSRPAPSATAFDYSNLPLTSAFANAMTGSDFNRTYPMQYYDAQNNPLLDYVRLLQRYGQLPDPNLTFPDSNAPINSGAMTFAPATYNPPYNFPNTPLDFSSLNSGLAPLQPLSSGLASSDDSLLSDNSLPPLPAPNTSWTGGGATMGNGAVTVPLPSGYDDFSNVGDDASHSQFLANNAAWQGSVPMAQPIASKTVQSSNSNTFSAGSAGNSLVPSPYTYASQDGRTINYRQKDGSYDKRIGGSKAWRTNNPGNMKYGPFSKSNGAIGTYTDEMGTFSVFPDEKTGLRAHDILLKEDRFQNKTLNKAIEKYAPKEQNNTEAYQRFVARGLGVSGNTIIRTLPPDKFEKLKILIRKMEHWEAGKTVHYPRKDR